MVTLLIHTIILWGKLLLLLLLIITIIPILHMTKTQKQRHRKTDNYMEDPITALVLVSCEYSMLSTGAQDFLTTLSPIHSLLLHFGNSHIFISSWLQ